jgi:hypothetical protein
MSRQKKYTWMLKVVAQFLDTNCSKKISIPPIYDGAVSVISLIDGFKFPAFTTPKKFCLLFSQLDHL